MIPENGSLEDCDKTRGARKYFEPIIRMLVRDETRLERRRNDFQGRIQSMFDLLQGILSVHVPFKSLLGEAVNGALSRNWTVSDLGKHFLPFEDFFVQ